ncbi:MAG: hypothetical protein Q4B26_16470, partial [Eubacteriales bacterium]|nr:hypothetical protein [Eubacteriales bacterium]
EAEKLGMQVWILDDKHFPTGYAAGSLVNAPLEKKRRFLTHHKVTVKGGKKVSLSIKKNIKSQDKYDVMSYVMLLYFGNGKLPKKIRQDELLSVTARCGEQYVNLAEYVQDEKLKWIVPEGEWTIEFVGLTYDAGMHRDYINMLDTASCQAQIDAVYEPHWEHFKDKFGTVIAGFFSDEPEIGNGNYLKHYNLPGTEQTLPYSNALAAALKDRWGDVWTEKLSLLWSNGTEAPKIRYDYMDCVTRLVEQCFSKKLGEWCREHGVEYIGHVIEDNNQHARTSTSLGHYFRGLKYQTMAGIDDIGDQVLPQGEDRRHRNIFGYENDGEFYHYALGKLGTSLAELNPRMQGRCMCEIFGNYGWEEGVRLEKYLLDHFLVRGVNYFVPHAFTCSDYPEKDCPPHFYAQGNNPQYRHFGEMMKYAGRVTKMISSGQSDAKVAILYHGESEWAGKTMLMQKPARVLYDHQIDFRFVPSDVFEEPEFYKTEITDKLTVNGKVHEVFIVPACEYVSEICVMGLTELIEKGGRVLFLDSYPKNVATGQVPTAFQTAKIVSLNQLPELLSDYSIKIMPENDRVRILHYNHSEPSEKSELYLLVNEGEQDYTGSLDIAGNWCQYDAWTDRKKGIDLFHLVLKPYESLILVRDHEACHVEQMSQIESKQEFTLTNFTQSICRAIDYPNFTGHKEIRSLKSYEREKPKFSGFIRYETHVTLEDFQKVELLLTEVYEGSEVVVNGISCGIQVVPDPVFDITGACKKGENHITIEVATSLARERGKKTGKTGIAGVVKLKTI